MRILVTGATGLIGKELGKALFKKGHELLVVSRNRQKAQLALPFPCQVIESDLGLNPLDQKLDVDAVFHLLGESVAGRRWNKKVKDEIINSRLISTRNLNQSLQPTVGFYLSASAVGFYGDQPGKILTEQSDPDNSFLSQVCQSWEKEVDSFSAQSPNTKVAKIRIGLVLSKNGGALQKMLLPFKLGMGGALGNGKHYMSWIHIQDLVSLMIFAFENKLSGSINGCSPGPVTNQEFSESLARGLNRRLGPAVPRFALNILFGEMAQILFDDQKAIPEKALNSGFVFKFPDLKTAFDDVLNIKTEL